MIPHIGFVKYNIADVGGCPTDNMKRHGAPYWERAEIRSKNLSLRKTHIIEFEVNFDKETRSSDRTSFFQIHTHNDKCTDCVQAVNLRIDGWGQMHASVMTPSAPIHLDMSLATSRESVAGRWAKFKVELTTNPGVANPLKIEIDGATVLDIDNLLIVAKARPHIKIGLYRPGNVYGLPTDRVSIRNITSTTVR
jgi:hypothetical protein